MTSPRLAYGSLHHHGANLLPDDLEGVDYLLLDGGPPRTPIDLELREAVERLAPQLYLDPELKVIVTLAGADESRAAERLAEVLVGTGSADLPIGVVRGSRVLDRIEEFFAAGQVLRHNATGEPFMRTDAPPRLAVLAFDAEPLVAATQQGARVVLVGHADLETVRLQLLGEIRMHGQTTALTIKLETGAAARLLVRGTPGSVQPLADAWLAAIERAGMPTEGANCKLAAEQSAEGDHLLVAAYRAPNAVDASNGLRLLRQLVADGDGDFVDEMGPEVRLEYATWPTSITTDLVEWSTDVRSAQEWIRE